MIYEFFEQRGFRKGKCLPLLCSCNRNDKRVNDLLQYVKTKQINTGQCTFSTPISCESQNFFHMRLYVSQRRWVSSYHPCACTTSRMILPKQVVTPFSVSVLQFSSLYFSMKTMTKSSDLIATFSWPTKRCCSASTARP